LTNCRHVDGNYTARASRGTTSDFTQELPEPFDQGFMRALIDYGRQRARRAHDWSKTLSFF
jgi:hypothetical protein